jgi:hypothetical protein
MNLARTAYHERSLGHVLTLLQNESSGVPMLTLLGQRYRVD